MHLVGLALPLGRRGHRHRATRANELLPLVLDNNVHISEYKAATCDIRPGRRPRGPARLELVRALPPRGRGEDVSAAAEPLRRVASARSRCASTRGRRPTASAPERVGFFTDTSVCIGCKACEVACKEWNQVPDVAEGLHAGTPTTTRSTSAPTPGATWRSSSSSFPPSSTAARPGRGRAARGDGRRGAWRRYQEGEGGLALADGLGRVQALHPRRLPGGLPDRRAVPHRVRHGRRAGGRLQRLRLLRAGVSRSG